MEASGSSQGFAGERIGRVIAVSAAEVTVLLETPIDEVAAHRPPVQMGVMVKIDTRLSAVFGMVCGLRTPLPSFAAPEADLKIIQLELIGERLLEESGAYAGFQRGVSVFPALADAVHFTTPADLAEIYAPPRVASISIGTIHQDRSIAAYLLTDDLLGKHFSVVGTTGTGKSCAVASILRSIIDRNPNGHVVLLDPHNEYSRAFVEQSIVLSPDGGLRLPYWLFNFEELAEIVLGLGSQNHEQRKILGDIVLAAKQNTFVKSGWENGTIDTPIPYRMSDVLRSLEAAMGALNRPESIAAYQAVKSRILALQNDARFSFVFGASLSLRDEMPDILSQLFRIPVDGKPVTILDLSGIPSEVLNVVVSVICRMTFDFAMWSEDPVPVTIVCEEAHRYAPRDTQLGFEPAKRALSRIAKEGRKYGVSLCVVTQRPSELTASLLSECNTLFAMRMSNQDDQEIVRGALPESSHGLMDFLPALRNGEAIVVGEGVSMPMRISFAQLPDDRSPRSQTASFTRSWSQDVDDRTRVSETVERWRRGVRHAA
jgi:uncharacterized protein